MLKKHILFNAMYSLSWIGLCLFIGRILEQYLTLLPASLYGMLLFALCLSLKIIHAESVKNTMNWIISNMGVCFVPAGVGVMQYKALIVHYGFAICSIIVITTLILLTLVGVLYQKHLNKKDV